MNDEELERRLRALRPTDLPEALQMRLAAPPAMRNKVRWLWTVAPLAAAAVWLLLPLAQPPGPAPSPKPQVPRPSDFRVYIPVHRTSTLVRVEKLDVIETESAQPVRLVRATWVDEITYAGDDGHSTIKHRSPRDQIIPVALTSY